MVDHTSNTKLGDVWIYYKNSLPLKVIAIKYFQKCMNLELVIGDSFYNFILIYRSPSQTHDEFEFFIKNFGLNLNCCFW